MTSQAKTPEEYLAALAPDRVKAFTLLRSTIQNNLPKGFKEEMSCGMIGYVVPHSLFPAGYHCNLKLPLPFVSIASQKNFISFHHMGLYANKTLLAWFTDEYKKVCSKRLDMGKACVRFKHADHIPYDLIGELVKKVSVEDWIQHYQKAMEKQQ